MSLAWHSIVSVPLVDYSPDYMGKGRTLSRKHQQILFLPIIYEVWQTQCVGRKGLCPISRAMLAQWISTSRRLQQHNHGSSWNVECLELTLDFCRELEPEWEKQKEMGEAPGNQERFHLWMIWVLLVLFIRSLGFPRGRSTWNTWHLARCLAPRNMQ